jgi:hypothetical protein
MQLVDPAAFQLGRLIGRLERVRPVYVVTPLCILSWLVTLAFALHVKHNGFVYYNGGDGTYYWTFPWALAHHLLPPTRISYGLPVFLWPLSLVFGAVPFLAQAVRIVGQISVLGPLAVVGIYGIASRIGGRLFGLLAGFAWAMSPVVAYHFFYPRVRADFGAVALPGVLGLNNLADYPSLVLTILIAWFVLRALDDRRWNDIVIAGTLCGLLIAVKPSNGFFVPAPICALLVARRWRETGGFVLAMVPALVTLSIWKEAGLGEIPLFGANVVHVAAGASLGGAVDGKFTHYIPFHWHNFTTNLSELREYGWSLRLAEWVPIAGLVGVFRRGIPQAVLLGLWCIDYLVIKGGTSGSTIYSWSYFRYTMPGFPAFVLLACCVVFLIPGWGRRWRPIAARAVPLRATRGLIAIAVVFSLYPLVFVLAHGGPATNRVALDPSNNLAVIADSVHLEVVSTPAGPSLRWRRPAVGPTKVGFVVFRSQNSGCVPSERECDITASPIRLVHSLSFPAWQTGAGIYRIGIVAGPHVSRDDGDLYVLSPPVRVR